MEAADGSEAVALDEQLAPHVEHLRYRYATFRERKSAIEAAEGSLDAFSRGYERFGFTTDASGEITFREWAPAASHVALIGDFNDWNGDATPLRRSEFGTWEVTLPKGAIAHGSRVKVRVYNDQGQFDRIPAWIRRATVEPGVMGAGYDGVYWAPEEKYEFKNAKPKKPVASRIYEAHVGMSSNDPKINSYREFADDVLPRVAAGGYNTVQLMAVMEHAYYGSFGYHVTNPFAVSSRSGTPEDLKYLVDKAHGLGVRVLLDVVHSHASSNTNDGIAGFDLGQRDVDSYFGTGEAGYHWLWDSRLYKYDNWEVMRYLLSNLRYWVDEYNFDGFRFDGVTSMLYHHHGLQMEFSGDYEQYFSTSTNVDGVVYLMLANELLHSLYPEIEVIAEDVSGMPTLCLPVDKGGVGFDARLAMSIPDFWVKYLKTKPDEQWSTFEMVSTLCNRRYTEKAIAYVESHDQSIVGDKTTAFWLMDAEMYDGMSTLNEPSVVIERGIALHKMLRLVTASLGGEGYLTFMGNEFGHPEWVDFPREGNGWSHDYCRRRWDLADADHLRYQHLLNFDKGMLALDDQYSYIAAAHQHVSTADDNRQILVFERGPLVFVFNFHPHQTYEGLEIGVPEPGKYQLAFDTDAREFGGKSRCGFSVDHFTSPDGPESWVGPYEQPPRAAKMLVLSPARSAQVYFKVPEPAPSAEPSVSDIVREIDADAGAAR
ncbi:Glycosyl hydrolase, family 13, catalytic domain [Ostreococcus tauri]|nr:Glycosyl hydrolase, family 13, catalytic domain [Ostreococcus tauri]CEF97678.1 Glycosyl hydrolase, family 13, catalytic domain [Ostreococcus tauri]|eukprot:XP_003078929.2 Glycosyl hydrolase, family 13, catalytic domain [Ostreococcus tauri]